LQKKSGSRREEQRSSFQTSIVRKSCERKGVAPEKSQKSAFRSWVDSRLTANPLGSTSKDLEGRRGHLTRSSKGVLCKTGKRF
jgi:hypothetical protein